MNKEAKLKSLLRTEIDLDWFYVVTIYDSEISLQGKMEWIKLQKLTDIGFEFEINEENWLVAKWVNKVSDPLKAVCSEDENRIYEMIRIKLS